MTSAATIEQLEAIRIVPVVVIDDAAHAADLVSALWAGGIGCAEITLRTEDGLAAIAAAAAAVPEFLVGAGTVLTAEQVDRSVDAGARFIVSPGYDDEVVARAQERGVAVVPGVATATEIMRARRAGLTHLKFFPAVPLGGVAALSALSGPFHDLRFLPSGGISLIDAAGFLALDSVFAVSGSWMASRVMIANGSFDEIEKSSRATVELLR
jgi:2-dehydro-3-deoxyphosphogluconate aldolase/(4S)-4-hydroxy-2-oxoglutarate aldolase